TPSGAFCSTASRSRMAFAFAAQARVSGQLGHVIAAMYTPAASPTRWLLADEYSEKFRRTNSACRKTESSHRLLNRAPAAPSKSGEDAPPSSCHATDQLMSLIAASSALDQFGPRG